MSSKTFPVAFPITGILKGRRFIKVIVESSIRSPSSLLPIPSTTLTFVQIKCSLVTNELEIRFTFKFGIMASLLSSLTLTVLA